MHHRPRSSLRIAGTLLRSLSLLAVLASLSLPAQTGTPTFVDATVHDPSVIHVDDRFYVFGSHGASAWTDDLMGWTQVATSVNSGNPPHFDTFQSELSELITWTNANTLWAADVVQLEDGRFYYYYNVWTDYQGYRSYMGLAVADEIEGPYTDLGELMRGGTGVSGFNSNIHPNTIDPHVFFDAEGRLWMVYGSYSGGIFILEMDPDNGRPLPDQGYGIHLWGGNHTRIEGPYILYNPHTAYYYLFVSYGGLDAVGGYNIRVARSTRPEGPYLDSADTDMATVMGPAGSFFDDAAIAPHGVKLMGNFRFQTASGEPGTSARGYVSPGHNSAYYDAAEDKAYLFFHTRFVGTGEQHAVRVHQLYFNEDGWPVVAPHRYAHETLASDYDPAIIAGSWKIIEHGKDISAAVKTSSTVELGSGGSVSGDHSGSWEMIGGHDLRITLGGTEYRGVVSHQWDSGHGVWLLSFSALSADGAALWGSEVASDRTSLEVWRRVRFGSEAGSAIAADDVDADGDGLVNLLEYAVRSDPRAADASTVGLTLEAGQLALRFERIMDPALSYSVELSGDLVDWSDPVWSSSGQDNTIGTVTVPGDTGVSADSPQFLRLKVER